MVSKSLGIVSAVLLSSSLSTVFSANDQITVNVHTDTLGYPIASDFASFSYEVSCCPTMFTFNGQPRTSFVNLMNNLKTASGGTRGPNMRIGGNSADESVYLPPGQPLPNGDTYRINATDFAAYLMAVPLWNGTITPGVNFRDASDASLAVAHIQALTAMIPWSSNLVQSIEVGNECDLFGQNGIRPSSYSMKDYLPEFDLYQKALQSSANVPYPRIQGATFCCHESSFDGGLSDYIHQYGSSNVLNTVSYHEYPLNVCGSNKEANSIYDLLANNAVDHNIPKLTPFISSAADVKIPFYIGEGNSVACGGQNNVSNVFAATLWSVDTLFTHAAAGIQRWNFHGCFGGAYTAIAYEDDTTDTPSVRPLYYGMWAFTSATTRNSKIYNTDIQSSNDLVKVWVTRDTVGTWHVTAIHKDVNRTSDATVTVKFPSGTVNSNTGTLLRLAPNNGNPYSSTGIAYGGLTFDGSTNGKPNGTPASEKVNPNSDGSYTFNVHPTSVVTVSISTN